MSIRTQRGSTRFGVAAIAAALIASLFAFASPAGAAQTVTTTRVSGLDRYDTAARIALADFGAAERPNNNAILVSGENYPDGLAAASLAGGLNAPVLLTATNGLPAVTASALATLGTTKVYVIGGTAAVSQQVRDQLTSLGLTLVEIKGENRSATAAAVSTYVRSSVKPIGSYLGQRTAIVATGNAFPDALSAGTLAASGSHPILLTDDGLPAATSAELVAAGVKRVIIMGGTAAVSTATEDAIKALGITTQRISGADRAATAAALAQLLVTPAPAGFTYNTTGVVLVSADTPWDALPAGPFATRMGPSNNVAQPILLAGGAATETYLKAAANAVSAITAIGGTAAVSAADLDAAKQAATTATPTVTISAFAGSTGVKLTFSEKIATTGTVTSGANNGSVALASDGLSAIVTMTSSLSANDVVTVSGFKTPASAGGRTVAPTTFVVGADAPGTGAISAVAGPSTFQISTSRSAAYTEHNSGGPSGATFGGTSSITVERAGGGAPVLETVTATVKPVDSLDVPYNTSFLVTLDGALKAGDVIKVTNVQTSGGSAITIPQVTVGNDLIAPTLTSATLTTTGTKGFLNTSNDVTKNVYIEANNIGPESAAIDVVIAAAAGNEQASVTVTQPAPDRVRITAVKGTAAGQNTPVALAAAINANATAAGYVTATGTGTVEADNLAVPTPPSTTNHLSAGTRNAVVTMQFSEGLNSASATTVANYDLSLQGNNIASGLVATAVVSPASSTVPSQGKVTMSFSLGAGQFAAAGTSQVLVKNVTDLAGNTIAPAWKVITAS